MSPQEPAAAELLREIACALRWVDERHVRRVIVRPADPGAERFIEFSADPGIFWGEAVADRFVERGRLGERGAARMERLGWRPPGEHIPNWFQYFRPQRKRHYRELAAHVVRTFREGYRESGPLQVLVDESAPVDVQTFLLPGPTQADADRRLLDLAEQVLGQFAPERHDDHLELTVVRRRHSVRLAVSCLDRTISVAALYQPAPPPELVSSALAVSDQLDRVPYTYGLRVVAGHGESLVLLSKVAVLPEQRQPWLISMLLYATIEPLVAAHRALVESAWGDRISG